MGNTLTLNITNGPHIPGADAEPVITCLLAGTRQEIKIRSDLGGRGVYPLYETLRRFHDGDPAMRLAPNPDFKVILRADENTEYQFLQPVLAECTRAGVNYDFATQRGEAEPQ
jgi:hypothetical protein